MAQTVVTGNRVLLSDFDVPKPATISIDGSTGKITDIQEGRQSQDSFPDETNWVDAGDKVVIPGLVESVSSAVITVVLAFTHVVPVPMSISMNLVALIGKVSKRASTHGHQLDFRTGFWTGTRAAASGGVTTVIDMPLNSIPPTTTLANLEVKRAAAQGQCFTDVAFWGGVIPGNQAYFIPRFITS